jgi:hypothetical protein
MQRSRTFTGPVISIAMYRPKRGKQAQLLKCLRDHLPVLRSQKLVTPRRAIVMRSANGTIVEVFEWKSVKAIEEAHRNPVVAKLCKRYDACCTYVAMIDLDEVKRIFPGFEPVKV